DGTRLATAGGDGVHVFDVATGADATDRGHAGDVGSIAFAPDGKTIASSGGGSIRLWDAASGAPVREIAGHGLIRFAPDGGRGGGGATPRRAGFFAARGAARLRSTELGGERDRLDCLGVSPSLDRVFVGLIDTKVRVVDASSGTSVGDLAVPGTKERNPGNL